MTAGSSLSPSRETLLPLLVVIVALLLSAFSNTSRVELRQNVLVLFDVQDLTLGLPIAPVPAHRLTGLRCILGLGLGLVALLRFIVAFGFVGSLLLLLLLGGRFCILGTCESLTVNECSLIYVLNIV